MICFAPHAFALAALAAVSFVAPGPMHAQEADETVIREMALGEPDAPVTIVEYASLTCPHCATFHDQVLPDLKREYIDTGKVRFVHREVYFDRYGLWASMVARCGGEMRFFGILDRIYETQSEWTASNDAVQVADNLRRIGLAAGLSEDQLNQCLNDRGKAEALVAWYERNAAEDDIDSTPSFIIDGEKYSNMPFAEFSDTLDALLPGDG